MAAALDEFHAKRVLECREMPADNGPADVEVIGRTFEAERFSEVHELYQMVDFHKLSQLLGRQHVSFSRHFFGSHLYCTKAIGHALQRKQRVAFRAIVSIFRI